MWSMVRMIVDLVDVVVAILYRTSIGLAGPAVPGLVEAEIGVERLGLL